MDIGTISSRYAKALFSLAKDKEQESRVYDDMKMLADSFSMEPELRGALSNPIVSVPEKVKLLTAAGGIEVCELYSRFINLVLAHKRALHEMNHSANRGACMQVCRRSYTVRDKETDVELDVDNQYIMSPKDLKTIHFMNKMLDAGVRVFKIEGRARGPEYVRTVAECYKEAIRSYLDGTFTDEKIAAWDERLKTVFNRGFWDGYYLGQRLGEWTKNYGSAATERKIYVGKGIRYFSNIGVAEFLVEAAELNVGDKLLITGPTTGAVFTTLDEARVDLKPVQTVKKGQHFSMKADKIRPSDKLYKLVSTEELKKFKGLDIEKTRG